MKTKYLPQILVMLGIVGIIFASDDANLIRLKTILMDNFIILLILIGILIYWRKK